MTTDTPKPRNTPAKRRIKARRTTGRSAGISQSAFAGYGHQQPATQQQSPKPDADASPEAQEGESENSDALKNAAQKSAGAQQDQEQHPTKPSKKSQ